MHTLLGRSINSPIVIPDDDDEPIKSIRSAGSRALAKPQGSPVRTPAGVAGLQNGMGVMGLYPKTPVDPGVRLLRRIEVGQSSSAMWQQMTGGDSEMHSTSHSTIGDGDNSSLKRKRTTSIDISNLEQGSLGSPDANVVESWPDLAASGQIDRLTKKQRKKFNKHLRERAEKQRMHIVPPVENILGWSAQFRDDATSQMSIDYGYGLPPPPLTTPPPIPMSLPPHQPTYPFPQVLEHGDGRMPSSSRQDHGSAEKDLKQPLLQRSSPSISSAHNTYNASRQDSQGQPVQSSRDTNSKWPPSLFVQNNRMIGSVIKDTNPHLGAFDLTGFHIHPPPIIERTLVMDSVPRKFRIPEYFDSWCREIGLSRPLAVLTSPKHTKALLEFQSEEQAHKAFNSPRLTNTDGRSGMRLYWYTPLKESDVTPSRDGKTSSKPQIAPQSTKPPPSHVQDEMEEGEICEDEYLDATQAPVYDDGHPSSVHRIVGPLRGGSESVSAKENLPIIATHSDMDIDFDRASEVVIDANLEANPTEAHSILTSSATVRVNVGPGQDFKNSSTDVNEVEGPSNLSISAEPSPSTVSGTSTLDKLAQLRQRVLASKRKRPTSSENSSTPDKMDSASDAPPVPHFSTSSMSSISVGSSTSSFMSIATASSSKSLSANAAPIVTSSHLDDLATDFLNNILGPHGFARNAYRVRIDRKAVVEEKQRRLERHITDSKQLMSNYAAASSKAERDQIMKVIREKNRKFDSENAESEAALQRLQKETRFNFTWPETKRDDTILVISDSEDDCLSDEEF